MFRTNFSFRKATGSPEQVVERLAELGYTNAPIADFNNTFAWVRWSEACKKHGLKPIFGVSLNVTPMIEAKKPVTDVWNFYAIDDVKPLNDLVRKAYSQGRSLPRIGFTPLIKYSDIAKIDNLICVSGYRARLEHMNPEQPNVYVGLQPACAKGFVQAAIDGGFKFFATQDARYVMPEDRDFYEITCGYDCDLRVWPQWIMDDSQWRKSVIDNETLTFNARMNRLSAFENCTAELKKASLPETTDEQTLEEICRSHIAELIPEWNETYEERLAFELNVINSKGLAPYFHLVGDLMRWARNNMALGPGRGSSSGSLVCFLCGITRVDPVKNNLLFFRFLDPARTDAADCDLDVSNAEMCLEYLSAKYGYDHVAKLGATGSFQAAGATNDVAKSLRLPRFEFNTLLESLPKYAAGDSRGDKALAVALEETDVGRNILKKYPTFKFAGQLSGNPSHAATHAAGIIITKEPLSNYVAVDTVRKTAMVDLKDAEKLDLLKLDVLSLDTLLLFEKTLEYAGLPFSFIDQIPFDDQAAFDVLNSGKTTGLFQLSGHTAKALAAKVVSSELNDIVTISAMARPGPLQSGGAESWARRRMGKEPVTYAHPIFEPYLKNTLGVFAYQEQIMMIAHDLGGLDWAQVGKLRKAIGKSLGPEAMREYGEPFKAGLLSRGVSQEVADKFWNDILGCGSYLFSLNHAYPYGMMSYYSCYLKAHYPLEFAAAGLTLSGTKEKQIEFLREMKAEGVDYVPFDIEHSTDKWTVATKGDKKILVGPLQNVKGLGVKSVMQILGARARGEAIPDSLQKKLTNAKTDLDSLHPIRDAIKEMDWQSHVNGRLTNLNKALPTNTWEPYEVIGLVTKCEEQSENDAKKIADRLSRGQQGILPGDPKSIQIRLRNDDTTDFLCKVTTKQLDVLRDYVLEKVQVGKSIVVVRGKTVPNVPCLLVNEIEVIGEM